MPELDNLYRGIGGRFITPVTEIADKLKKIKAFVFDWDGVFNNGEKQSSGGSNFSEVDSMGQNLLRFSYYLKNNKLPVTAILSGEKNETAFYFSERECFSYSLFKIPHKLAALEFLCEKEKINAEEVAYFFDDVLDIPIAERCGIRLMVNQKVNPLFTDYCIRNKLVDYLSVSPGGAFAVRETTELLIGLQGNYDAVLSGRKNNSPEYQSYINNRRKVKPEYYTLSEDEIVKVASPLR